MCSFRMFLIHKPDVEEVLSTEVTEEDLKNAVVDECGVKYSKDGKRLLKAPENLKGEYVIKYGTKVIGNDAFLNCELLKSTDIPNSVTSIGEYAFYCCKSLANINIPNSVTSIGAYTFYECI